jgi:hypothetical protein
MGQQQLLLLILAAVIVGTAIVVGVNMFQENAGQSNQEAVVQDVLTLASRVQAWYRRPLQMGGGGHDFSTATLANLDWPTANDNAALFSLTGASASEITIRVNGREDPDGDGTDLFVRARVTPDSAYIAEINP